MLYLYLSADLINIPFFKIFFQKYYQCQTVWIQISTNRMDRYFVGPDLCPNCLQSLSADDKKVTANKEGLTLCLIASAADNLCKQFGPRPGPTKLQP